MKAYVSLIVGGYEIRTPYNRTYRVHSILQVYEFCRSNGFRVCMQLQEAV